MKYTLLIAALLGANAVAQAHDTWIESNTPMVRPGDDIQLSLMLGNHGNMHRDFKQASKLSRDAATMWVMGPQGAKRNLTSSLQDTGYTPQEGFWTTHFTPSGQGLYTVFSMMDGVESYAPYRGCQSAKSYFLATKSLDTPLPYSTGFDKPLGAALELVPQTNPVAPMGPGVLFIVQLLLKGKPLANTPISFIPRGTMLKGEFDATYERKTDAKGMAKFEFKEPNTYLIAAHHQTKESGQLHGEPYKETHYGATLTVHVPRICPCCG